MKSKLLNPVRLACIRPAASVHPEPGSNSPLYNVFVQIQTLLTQSIEICKKKYSLTLSILKSRFNNNQFHLAISLPLRCIIYSLSLLRTSRFTSRICFYVVDRCGLNFQCFTLRNHCDFFVFQCFASL